MFVSLTYSGTTFVFPNKNILYFLSTLQNQLHDASVTSSFSIFRQKAWVLTTTAPVTRFNFSIKHTFGCPGGECARVRENVP